MTDEELIAEDRRVARLLGRLSGDLDRLAAELLRQNADRLEGKPGYLEEAAAEVRAMLAANDALAEDSQHLPADHEARRLIRAERREIIDRLIALGYVYPSSEAG